MDRDNLIHLENYKILSREEMVKRSRDFYERIKTRRSVRLFSTREIPREVILNCLKAAGTSPSGANKQPWSFAVISDTQIKKQIREAAESAEKAFYENQRAKQWHEDLKELQTDFRKPFLEQAPYLIVIFAEAYDIDEEGRKHKNYYVKESVGIMSGILISALHLSGLAVLTYTPSRSAFLNTILKRPKNEKPFLILPVGYPAEDARVPQITKKTLDETAVFY